MKKIFLDDFRIPRDCISYMSTRIGDKTKNYAEEWIIVKNYNEFKEAIKNNHDNISHISFDHDLADEHYDDSLWENNPDHISKEKTGKDCAIYFKEYYDFHKLEYPEIYIHSMNPVGCERIKNVLE